MRNTICSMVLALCCLLLTPLAGQASEVTIDLASGWNLLNSPLQPEVATMPTVLGAALATTTSVWKWEGDTWAVYLPGAGDGGMAYAAGKGFGTLADLSAGEGFWLNMKESGQLHLNGQYPAAAGVTLVKGWNLVGLKGEQSAQVTEITADQGLEIVSAWKWSGATWAVYLPGEEDKGAQYASGKGFALLATIAPHQGFWVNVAAASVATTTTASPVTTTTTTPLTTTTTTLPPNVAVGKVFAKIGPNLVPVQGAKVLVDEQQVAESSYAGLFTCQTATAQTVTIEAAGYAPLTGTLTPGATRGHFLLVPILEEVIEEGGNDKVLAKVKDKGDLFMTYPNLFIMEGHNAESAKPTPKDIADDHATLTISNMSLQKDITVAVDTFLATEAIVDAAGVDELLGAGQVSAVIGGANVLITDGKGAPTTSQAAGFGGNVRARLTDFNLSGSVKSLASMQADLTQGSGMVYLFAYSPQEDSELPAWQLVGEGSISAKDGVYTVSAADGVVMDGLYPFLFLYGSKKSITGTVVRQGASGMEPVANALIKLQNSGATTVSGLDGGFTLNIPDILTKGSIRVYHEEYYRLQKKVSFPKGATVQDFGQLVLTPLTTFDLQGVFSDHHGAPLVGAEVRLKFVVVPPQITFPSEITTRTDESGAYQFPHIPQELKTGATVEVTTKNGFHVLLDQAWPPATAGVVTLNATLVTPIWIYKTGGNLYGAPAVGGESLFLGGVDGKMRRLDAVSGEELWAVDTKQPIFATPALDQDTLYFGTVGGQLLGLKQATGAQAFAPKNNEWSTGGSSDIIASSVLVNGMLSFGSNDDSLYFYATNGELQNVNYLGNNVTGSAAVANNTIYFGGWDGRFYAFTASGDSLQLMDPQWRFPSEGEDPLPARILSSALAVDGKVYFGGGNNLTVTLSKDDGTKIPHPFTTDGTHQTVNYDEDVVGTTITVDKEDKRVYCLNATDGALLWTRDLDGAVVGRPAVSGSTLIVATLHGTVSAFDLNAAPTAPPIWTFTAQEAVYSSPVVSAGRVYFGSSDHYFYSLDAATGAKLWSMKSGGEIIAAPVVAAGRIFIASLDGVLYCVEE